MEQGKKFDSQKTRHELLPPFAIEQMAKVLTLGANKYGDRNWEAGINWSRIIGAIKRHTAAIERGEDFDQETGLLHSAHLLCESGFLTEFYQIGKRFDDRQKPYMARVGLDIDDVIADFVGAYCSYYKMPRPTSWNFDKDFIERYQKLVTNRAFWASIAPLCDPDTLPFEPVCYITNRGCPKEWTEDWLIANRFPLAPVLCAGVGASKVDIAKDMKIDVFVDDCFKNFCELNQAGVLTRLFTASHNKRHDVGHLRINDLRDIFKA